MGSLCSGPDYVKDFLAIVAEEIKTLLGAPIFVVENAFACEKDPRVWGLRSRAHLQPPACFYEDVHSLSLDSMPQVDLLLLSPMCTSLSRCNVAPRSLEHRDPADPREASGATSWSSLAYVRRWRPRVVILETVLGRWPAKPGQQGNRSAATVAAEQMEPLLAILREVGYVCAVDLVDAVDFGMPQTRQRVYCVAVRDMPASLRGVS